MLAFVLRKCNSHAWKDCEMFDSPHLSLGLISLPFSAHS